jgi:hypothetical protein
LGRFFGLGIGTSGSSSCGAASRGSGAENHLTVNQESLARRERLTLDSSGLKDRLGLPRPFEQSPCLAKNLVQGDETVESADIARAGDMGLCAYVKFGHSRIVCGDKFAIVPSSIGGGAPERQHDAHGECGEDKLKI